MCLNPLCYYPDILHRAAAQLKKMDEQRSVLGKLNVGLIGFCDGKMIWKTLKILAVEVKDRILLRKCRLWPSLSLSDSARSDGG